MDQPRRAAIEYIKRRAARERISPQKTSSSSLSTSNSSSEPSNKSDISAIKPLKKRAIKFSSTASSSSSPTSSKMPNGKRKLDNAEINAVLDNFLSLDSVVDQQLTAFKFVESVLQAVQRENPAFHDDQIKEKLRKSSSSLLSILNVTSNPELAAISGVALIRIFEVISNDPDQALRDLFKLLWPDESCPTETKDITLDLDTLRKCLNCEKVAPLGRLSIVYGITKSRTISSYMIANRELAEGWGYLLSLTVMLTSDPRIVHLFHCFRTIAQWFTVTKVKDFYYRWKSEMDAITAIAPVVPAVLMILDRHWESPVNGLNECAREIYASLYESMAMEPVSVKEEFINSQLKIISQLPWTSRAKYRKLAVVFRFIHYERILRGELQPLPKNMFLYLSVSNLSYPINDCYKSLIDCIIEHNKSPSQEETDALQKSELIWQDMILPHMQNVLVSSRLSATVHTNLVAHILPHTLKRMPKLLSIILKRLQSPEARLSLIAIIRIAVSRKDKRMTQQVIEFLNQSYPSISTWLNLMLSDEDLVVRKECLAIILDETLISDRQTMYHYLKLYLASNLSVDDPSFRQNVVSKMADILTTLFIRLSNTLKKHSDSDLQDTSASLSDELMIIHWFIEYLSLNLMPGTNFQRRFTCLQILKQLLSNVVEYKIFIEPALSPKLYHTLMLSIQDKYDGVRLLSVDALFLIHQTRLHFHKANPIKDGLFLAEEICDYAFTLTHSPKHQECHSGALLISLVCYILDTKEEAAFTHGGRKIARAIDLLDHLLDIVSCHLKSAQTESILNCAKNSPIHGLLLAISTTLGRSDVLSNMVKTRQFTYTFFRKCLYICEEVRKFALGIFTWDSHSAKSSDYVSPSFKEMMDSLISIMKNEAQSKTSGDDNGSKSQTAPSIESLSMRGDSETDSSIPVNIQYLASYCWLNIKESSILMTSIICNGLTYANNDQVPMILYDDILGVGKSLVDVLGRCRHIGAIEAVSSCLQTLTKMIVSKAEIMISKGIEDIQAIPMDLMKDSVHQKLRTASQTNITRRSAGLSLIILAILNGEASSEVVSQKFYHWVTLQLIEAANQPYDEITQGDETKDLPQAYARHVLKCIIMSSTLSKYTCSLADKLIPMCVAGFTSPRWALRNASLQLYGSCCTRILGQRKIRTDDVANSQFVGNTLTVKELFIRFPNLAETFYEVLLNSPAIDMYKSTDDAPSRLVPILSTLALLSPKLESGDFDDPRLRGIPPLLFKLIDSPYYKIRSLAAQSLTAFLPISTLSEELFTRLESLYESRLIVNWNLFHGLILLYRCIKIAAEASNAEDVQDIQKVSKKIAGIIDKFDEGSRMTLCRFEYEIARDSIPTEDWPLNISCPLTSQAPNPPLLNSKSSISWTSEFLEKLMDESEEDKSPEQRLSCVKYFENMDPSIFHPSASQYSAILTTQLVIRFLQDEDGDVRKEGSKIITQLLNSRSVPSRTKISTVFSFSVCLDIFVHYISQQTSLETMFEILYLYLTVKFEGLKDALDMLNTPGDDVLFEQEELNVFGEPVIVALKLAHAFYRKIFNEPPNKIRKFLKDECVDMQKKIILEDHQLLMHHHQQINQKCLQNQGIWKIPRLYGSLLSLWIRTQVLIHSAKFIGSINDLFDWKTKQADLLSSGLSILKEAILYEPDIADSFLTPGLQFQKGLEYFFCSQSPNSHPIKN